ncbi:MAG: Methyltransferase type 12 [Solirubrobacterales bacterium]|nr:Methyltransferase type 12 [Solirubrobacterales bacterium]
MGYRAFNEDDLVEEVVALDGRDLALLRPRDTDALLDEAAFDEQDEFIPYWADLWPSAILLARTLSGRALRGARVLELGCGLGLPSLAAAIAGGRVLATDWAADALAAVERNARHNELAVDTLVSDWREPAELLARGPFDLVIAADVLYERRNVRPLTQLIEALDAEVWLADPGRPPAAEMVGNLELAGWIASTLAATTSPRVTVHRLRPGHMY